MFARRRVICRAAGAAGAAAAAPGGLARGHWGGQGLGRGGFPDLEMSISGGSSQNEIGGKIDI